MNPVNPTPDRCCVGFLVRHGELNITKKWDGWGAYKLSDEGRQSAEKAGQWLGFERTGRMISSDLPRTLQTADIIMQCLDISCPFLATDPNLRAWALGDFTGKDKTPERKAELQFYRDNPDEMVPSGESWNQFRERVQVALQYLCTPYNALPTVIVTHNSVLKALMDFDEKGDLVDPGGIIRVDMLPNGELDFVAVLGETKAGEKAGLDSESSCG